MLRHIVAWNFKDEFSPEENRKNAEKVKLELEALCNLIPEIVELRVDIDLLKSSNKDVMLDSRFKDEETLAVYKVHPEHVRVSEIVSSVLKDRAAVDFYE